MPTIEVDIIFFLFDTIISFLAIPFLIGWTIWKSYKNPEFWLRLRKQGFVYFLILNPLNKLVQVVVPLKDIGEDGMVSLFKGRKYFWPDTALLKVLKEGIKTDLDPTTTREEDKIVARRVFNWKKSVAALFSWNDPMAQVWAPGNTIFSITTPDKLDDIMDMKILKLMMNADNLTKLMRLGMMIAVVAILVGVANSFGLFTINSALGHQSCLLSHLDNSTAAQVLCK